MSIHGYTAVNYVKDYLLYTYGDLLYEFSLAKGQNYRLIQRSDEPFDMMVNRIDSDLIQIDVLKIRKIFGIS